VIGLLQSLLLLRSPTWSFLQVAISRCWYGRSPESILKGKLDFSVVQEVIMNLKILNIIVVKHRFTDLVSLDMHVVL